jgi:glutamate dehydrogenase (NAD(P)+)
MENAEDMKTLGLSTGLAGKRVIVQGLGNVGYHAAWFLQHDGKAIITGIAEREGGIFNKDGLDVEAVFKFRRESGSLEGYPGAKFVENRMEVLEYECDILIPAALEDQITGENAPRIQAKIIAEAANGPVDFEGETILNSRGAMMIPDLYLNAGGVTVSYFEWLKNRAGVSFDRMLSRHEELTKRQLVDAIETMTKHRIPDEIRRQLLNRSGEENMVIAALDQTMERSYEQIHNYWKKHKLPDLRTASFMLAIERVSGSYSQHGIFP